MGAGSVSSTEQLGVVVPVLSLNWYMYLQGNQPWKLHMTSPVPPGEMLDLPESDLRLHHRQSLLIQRTDSFVKVGLPSLLTVGLLLFLKVNVAVMCFVKVATFLKSPQTHALIVAVMCRLCACQTRALARLSRGWNTWLRYSKTDHTSRLPPAFQLRCSPKGKPKVWLWIGATKPENPAL